MKKLLLLLTLAFTINVNAQDDKTVTLVVSGQGKTQDEARQKALRSAIEQAFGTFISSKTEILNDNLVKDEIVSVANGNIQKFEPVSEVQLPDGGYAATLKATVSVSKLTAFVESKGVEVEFKGGLFAMNIKLQKLNEESEVTSIRMLCKTAKLIVDKMFDYNISSNEPQSVDGNSDKWELNLKVDIKLNNNFNSITDYLVKSLAEIAMKNEDLESYKSLKKNVFPVELKVNEAEYDPASSVYYFRKEQSLALLQDLVWYIDFSQANFIISDGISQMSLYQVTDGGIKNESYYEPFPLDYRCEFKLSRSFDSSWKLYNNTYVYNNTYAGDGIYYNTSPYWGTAADNYGCTYDISKKNIIDRRKSRLNEIEREKKQIDKWKKTNPTYLGIIDSESNIKSLYSEIEKYTDSSTVFIWFYSNKEVPRSARAQYGYPMEENKVIFHINLSPNIRVNGYGQFIVKKYYTTDELQKITFFSVKSGKIENIKN